MGMHPLNAAWRRFAAAVCLECILLTGCASPAPPADPAAGQKTATIFLIERGWHTDIAIPATQVGSTLGQLRLTFLGVQTLVFGFGERAYLMDHQHGFADMLAALIPGPGAMLVTALRETPEAAFPGDVVVLHVSVRGLTRLADFVTDSFVRGSDGALLRLTDGPYPGSLFYASADTYSGVYTCNTWTAEALQTAGLPVHAGGVLFADDVANQARRIAAPSQ
jgi:uncharacterized protein (TIGR02117 family)